MELIETVAGHSVRRAAMTILVSLCATQPLMAQTDSPSPESVESQAREEWHAALSQNPVTTEGCFHASYPSLVWESVECSLAEPRVPPAPPASASGESESAGNGHDYVLGATGLITLAQGRFPKVKKVKSEKGIGVASFGHEGILGPNEFSLQINSNARATTSVCAGHGDCTVWQQFVYASDYFTKGKAAVFMQYWLLNWGTKHCPSGWHKTVFACYRNSASTTVPDLKITDLGNMALEAQATAGGHDIVTFYNGTEAYSVTAKDSVVQLGSVWTEAEFNVFGDGGGSRADFNSGADIEVLVRVRDGSSKAPQCKFNVGTTAETNNLNLGTCLARTVGSLPAIEFDESD